MNKKRCNVSQAAQLLGNSCGTPKILFIKNVFIKDCKIADDLMELKLMESANTNEHSSDEKQVKTYDKLPIIFTKETWPTTTNILCWYCNCQFNNMPLFIPNNIEPSNTTIESNGYIMGTEGCFCSFNCCYSYIDLYYPSMVTNNNKKTMLKFLYKAIYGSMPDSIIHAPNKYLMVQYGGDMSINAYQNIIQKLNIKS